jgi:acetylornithine deacetylase/succinyl-diaminopimelate desuccinylase-like protein
MSQADAVAPRLDRDYMVDILARLARVPTAVPLGYETLIEPDHPMLVDYVQHVLRPELVAIGVSDLREAPLNNLVSVIGGESSGPALLIECCTPTQHYNLMPDPFSGKIDTATEYGHDEPCVFGQGVSQNKTHQAVMLGVLKTLVREGVRLRGTLYWAINNEGRSTHACSEAIVAILDRKPDFAVCQLGTGLQIWNGNRGRVDVEVHVRGKAIHSSNPDAGLSAIDGANEVLNRLRLLTWPDVHPELGARRAIAYKIRYEPVAPHTLPSDAYITIDRRMLPGDDPEAAAAEIAAAIGDLSPYSVTARAGVCQYPSLVQAGHPWVQELVRAGDEAGAESLTTTYPTSCFDAGGLQRLGIPAVTFGARAGVFPLGVDFMPISLMMREARTLTRFILERLGPT